eukprot:TRINITY_DN1454_c0_g1_i1.p1 TRINITY_DN1454_c0_g1~~TRINITY_DN1454_c0_g1_i1.p1  ORF type:complete len:165 (+),score=17.08 TRINITY_DN1454_c0_g1_i1:21-515(+)
MTLAIATFFIGALAGLLAIDFQFDHRALFFDRMSPRDIQYGVSYYQSMDNMEFPYSISILAVIFAPLTIFIIYRLVAKRTLADVLVVVDAVALLYWFAGRLLPVRILLSNVPAITATAQEAILKEIAFYHMIILGCTLLLIPLEIWAHSASRSQKQTSGGKKRN